MQAVPPPLLEVLLLFILSVAQVNGKLVLGCGSNVADHIYNVKGLSNYKYHYK